MPQLIAMIIIVVGAMIYMFQTFGGTGDKIEGIAQKTSIITEVNNIKDGVKIAAKSGQLTSKTGGDGDKVDNLQDLAKLSYFAEQINEQLKENIAANKNVYSAISFGGQALKLATDKPNMGLSLVVPTPISGTVPVKRTPGIFVDFSQGNLLANAAFLESQIATDLKAIAYIDRSATTATAKAGVINSATDATSIEKRTPALGTVDADGKPTDPTAAALSDGKFILYFKDFGSDEVVE